METTFTGRPKTREGLHSHFYDVLTQAKLQMPTRPEYLSNIREVALMRGGENPLRRGGLGVLLRISHFVFPRSTEEALEARLSDKTGAPVPVSIDAELVIDAAASTVAIIAGSIVECYYESFDRRCYLLGGTAFRKWYS